MAKTKKDATKVSADPTPKTYTLTEEQFKSLKLAAELIYEARRELNDFEPDNLAAAGFIAGQAFVSVNKVEDALDEIVNSFEDGDDDWSWGSEN